MEKAVVKIGNKTYNCRLALTDDEQKQGLMGVEYLAPDEGMLFIWNGEGTREMWMKNCPIPIELIGINEDDEVIKIHYGLPNDETLIPFENTKYILEVNPGSEVEIGDEFEFDETDDLNKYVMKVLAPDGSAQFLLQSGERIISRKETRTLIRKAKRAEKNKSGDYDKYCKALGKYMFKVLKGQDERPAEYVSVPE